MIGYLVGDPPGVGISSHPFRGLDTGVDGEAEQPYSIPNMRVDHVRQELAAERAGGGVQVWCTFERF